MNFCNEQLLQRLTSKFLQRVTSEFLQRATSATSKERILQRVTSDFLQRATSATSNEQRVKSYASFKILEQRLRCRLHSEQFYSNSKTHFLDFPYIKLQSSTILMSY